MSRVAEIVADIRAALDRLVTHVTEPQERLIALSTIEGEVDALIKADNATIEDNNQHSWLQDIYSQDDHLYAVVVRDGKLYQMAIEMDGERVTKLGEAQSIAIKPAQASNVILTRALPSQAPGGTLFISVMCVTGINKMSIVDTRSLFDSFVAGFEGEGKEYVNLLHLGGAATRVGDILHLWRSDKLLVGIWRSLDTPVARAVAKKLSTDTEMRWGGSIEFEAFAGEPVTVAPGITLETFRDGNFLGYSIAPTSICASWSTRNKPLTRERTMSHVHYSAIEDEYRKILLELLGDEALVTEVEQMLQEQNDKASDPLALTLRLRAVGDSGAAAGSAAPGGSETPAGGDMSPAIAELQDRMNSLTNELGKLREDMMSLWEEWSASHQPATDPDPAASEMTITLDAGQIESAVNAATAAIDQRIAEMEATISTWQEQANAFESRFRALGVESEDAAMRLREQMPAQPPARNGQRPSQTHGTSTIPQWKPTGLFNQQRKR